MASKRWLRWLFGVGASAMVAACVSSSFSDGIFACDPITAPECPPGLVCAADRRCRASSILLDGSAPDTAGPTDAASDAGALPQPLLGDAQSGGAPSSTLDDGHARAFRFLASASGSVSRLAIQIDPSNQAATIMLGLYDDYYVHPGHLLATADVDATSPGWRTVSVSETRVTQGEPYWIAVLSKTPGQPVTFVGNAAKGAADAEDTSEGRLATLPTIWPSGVEMDQSPICAYASPAF